MNSVPERWSSLAILSLGGLVIGLDTTVLNVALPTLAVDLGASTAQLQWFADSYLLVLAVLLLPGGLLGDTIGRKPMTLISLGVFGAGSLWSAYAGSPESLIAARALMGAGAAFLTPLTFAWMIVLFDARERPKAMGALGAASFIGMPLGPILAGWLLGHYFWGSVFLINVPLIVIALVGGALLLPGGEVRTDRTIDWIGVLLSVTSLAGLTYGLIEAPVRGWGDGLVLGMVIGGAIVLAGFVRWESAQGRRALMDLSLWRLPAFSWGTGALVASTMLGMVALFSAPLYLQSVLGVDAFGAGIRLVPMIGGILVGVAASLIVSQRSGYKAAVLLGLVMIATGSALAALTTLDSGYGWTGAWLAVFGFGFGAIMISGQNLALTALDEARAGVGGAIVQVMRQTGGVIGIAVLISVLSSVYRARVDVAGLPPAVGDAVRSSVQSGLATARQLGDPELATTVKSAFLDGMDVQMWLGVGLALAVATAIALVMPRGLGKTDPEPDDRRTHDLAA